MYLQLIQLLEYYLMEKLNVIKKELGMDKGGKDKTIEKFRKRAEVIAMPEHIRTVFDEELMKLQNLESSASEFNVTRNYLEWLTQIPWYPSFLNCIGGYLRLRILILRMLMKF